LSSFFLNGTYYILASNAKLFATQGLATKNIDLLQTDHRLLKLKALRKCGSNAFDRNYAGGGAVYYDAPSGVLIQLYHGEFWYGNGAAYTSLGIAVSRDLGNSWKKLGQVLSVAAPRMHGCQSDIGNGSLLSKSDGYVYAYYSDLTPSCVGVSIGLARAKLSDIVNAARAGTKLPHPGQLFMKYHNGNFSQPGVIDTSRPALGGGFFTPMFSTHTDGWPTMSLVAYDSVIQQYVMTYVAGWNQHNETGVALRFSPDRIHWSDPTSFNFGQTTFYPSLVNTSGGDPNILGAHFYIYFVYPFPGVSTQNLMRALITVSAGPSR